MNTHDLTHTPSMMRKSVHPSALAVAAVALCVGTASAQMAPGQPAPAVTPATPSAAAATRVASQYEVVFKRTDADGDGFVSKAELEKADAKLGADFQKYDTDGDGKLSMPEFEAMMKSIKG